VHTPSDPNLLPEVTTKIPSKTGGRFTPLLSESGRVTPGGAPAAMSIPKALSRGAELGPGTTTRWDFIQVADATKPPTSGNVKSYIECKFPPDDLTKNQKKARRKMSRSDKKKVVTITPEKCGCP
jgi:hypothetical protein